MRTKYLIYTVLLSALMLAGCGKKDELPQPTPEPAEGYVRQSYDIEGLVIEDGQARVYGLVLNTGTLDIAYIGFTVELCDSRGNMLYEQRYETTLHAAVVPGDSYPFNCVFPKIYDEDAGAIAKVRIGDFVWTP